MFYTLIKHNDSLTNQSECRVSSILQNNIAMIPLTKLPLFGRSTRLNRTIERFSKELVSQLLNKNTVR